VDIEDHTALLDWLRTTERVPRTAVPRFETLRGGVSNRTVKVEFDDAPSWVIKQGLEKLRVDVDWFCDPARVHREAAGLRCLQKLLPVGRVPEFVDEDMECHVLIMTAAPRPHANWKSMLMAGDVQMAHAFQFGQLLGMIHRRGLEQRETIESKFADRSYFESLRLEPYYAYPADNHPEVSEFLRSLLDETRRRRLTLVHGDFSPKNILVHNDQLILLDHEVIHWGDPAFDIGFALTHLLSKAFFHVDRRFDFVSAATKFWQAYASTISGSSLPADLQSSAVRHTIGCLIARTVGRSPLEYLTANHREIQLQAATHLAHNAPPSVAELIHSFPQRVAN